MSRCTVVTLLFPAITSVICQAAQLWHSMRFVLHPGSRLTGRVLPIWNLLACNTSGMLLRPAKPGDEMAVARVHVRSWQVAYRTLMPQDYLDQLHPEDRAARYVFGSADLAIPHTIVAVENEEPLGFATTMPARAEDLAGHGELAALYVDPEHWGRRIGLALVRAARAHLVKAGFRNAMLWVLAGNTRADRFYQTDRWIPDGTRRTESVWGISVDELRYIRDLEAD